MAKFKLKPSWQGSEAALLWQLMEDALESPLGIKVECISPEVLRTALYKRRAEDRKRGLTKYDALGFYFSPDGKSLLILKKAPPE